ITGLFFIAVNRIISPAFYAQGNTKSPATAGILGFAVNILLALLLVGSMKGGGIALALTLASLANTIFLLIFLQRTKRFAMGTVVKGMISYSLKMVVLSVLASLPLLLLKDKIFGLFNFNNRILQEGLPLIIAALLFATVGVLLLIITRDSLIQLIVKKLRRRI
ncbi:MAG: polysaccharide biosynthesis C-terminal domain-containing protein, partial [Spirochaetaceae bacterium]|nr:polysaccharide biosynthesis C-terminal domain-containing protein [Spirochaetaceae bacterium]